MRKELSMHSDRIFVAFCRDSRISATLFCWFAFSADCVPQLVLELTDDKKEDNDNGNDDG